MTIPVCFLMPLFLIGSSPLILMLLGLIANKKKNAKFLFGLIAGVVLLPMVTYTTIFNIPIKTENIIKVNITEIKTKIANSKRPWDKDWGKNFPNLEYSEQYFRYYDAYGEQHNCELTCVLKNGNYLHDANKYLVQIKLKNKRIGWFDRSDSVKDEFSLVPNDVRPIEVDQLSITKGD